MQLAFAVRAGGDHIHEQVPLAITPLEMPSHPQTLWCRGLAQLCCKLHLREWMVHVTVYRVPATDMRTLPQATGFMAHVQVQGPGCGQS